MVRLENHFLKLAPGLVVVIRQNFNPGCFHYVLTRRPLPVHPLIRGRPVTGRTRSWASHVGTLFETLD